MTAKETAKEKGERLLGYALASSAGRWGDVVPGRRRRRSSSSELLDLGDRIARRRQLSREFIVELERRR